MNRRGTHMRKMLSFAVAAAMLAAPSSVLAISQHKKDKIAALQAKEDAIQTRRDALQQKAGGNPSPNQQARLAKLDARYQQVADREQKVEDRANKSN